MEEIQFLKQKLQLIELERKFLIEKLSLLRSMAISTPDSKKNEAEANPEQTATGKDKSNPLTPDVLGKSIEEDKSSKTKLVTPLDFISKLRPKEGIPTPSQKSAEKSVVTEQSVELGIPIPKNYYVVYNGPLPGIYTGCKYGSQRNAKC